jgi:hypothetical protein
MTEAELLEVVVGVLLFLCLMHGFSVGRGV